jgi:hypothetical protein
MQGVAAIRLATSDSASMLFQQIDADLDAYPMLSWSGRGLETQAGAGETHHICEPAAD